MRHLERNKTKEIYYSNPASETPIMSSYGEAYLPYEEIHSVKLALIPLSSEYEAAAYGVTLKGSFKINTNVETSKEFKELTRIWVYEQPREDLLNYDYFVRYNRSYINEAVIVIAHRE